MKKLELYWISIFINFLIVSCNQLEERILVKTWYLDFVLLENRDSVLLKLDKIGVNYFFEDSHSYGSKVDLYYFTQQIDSVNYNYDLIFDQQRLIKIEIFTLKGDSVWAEYKDTDQRVSYHRSDDKKKLSMSISK